MIRSSQPPADADATTQPIPVSPADLTGIIAVISVGALVFSLGWFKVASLDVGYHVAYGRHFLDTGHIVDQDPFLQPETARPFVNANWGSQVVMAAVERAAGASGLIGLRLVLIAVTFVSVAVVVRAYVGGWLAVAAAWMLAAVAAYERFSMRPELFSYALMSLQLLVLARGVRSWRSILVLAVVQVVWVNVHSYFVVGLLLTAVWLTAAVGRAAFKGRTNVATGDHPARGAKLLALCLLVQVCACLMNPWHVHGAVFPFATLGFLESNRAMGGAAGDPSDSAWSEISEFQSPLSFSGQIINHRTILAYYLLLGVGLFGAAALVLRGRVAEALVIVLLFLMSLKMRRNIAQFALLGAPLSVVGLAAIVPWTRIRAPLKRALRIGVVVGLVVVAGWWIVAIAGGRFYYVERRVSREFGTGYSDRTFPRCAVQWLGEQEGLEPNLFVDYFSSSNTLQWLPRRFKLFVDTNTFAYEDATLRTAFDLVQGRIPHERTLGQLATNIVLLRCGSNTQSLVNSLAKDRFEWSLVYFDPHVVIFVRRVMSHVDVIRENQKSERDLDPAAWIAAATGPDIIRAVDLSLQANVPLFLGWYAGAATLFEESVRLAPDYSESWINLGLCRAQLGTASMRARKLEEAVRLFESAAACFEKALALNPDDEIAQFNLERVRDTFRSGS